MLTFWAKTHKRTAVFRGSKLCGSFHCLGCQRLFRGTCCISKSNCGHTHGTCEHENSEFMPRTTMYRSLAMQLHGHGSTRYEHTKINMIPSTSRVLVSTFLVYPRVRNARSYCNQHRCNVTCGTPEHHRWDSVLRTIFLEYV